MPENITLLPKTGNQVTGGNSWNERTITVKKGESITTILRELGATPDEIKAIAAALGARGRDGGLKEGQRLRILVSSATGSQRLQPVRVIVTGDSAIEAVVALSDRGRYVPVDVTSMNTEVADAGDDDEEDDGKGMRLYHSLYETALRNQIPRPVIESLIRIYSYDVDFQAQGPAGRQLRRALRRRGRSRGRRQDRRDVRQRSPIGGETKKFYRFQTPDDGIVDYYDETGKSAKKFLVRKPLGQRHHALGLRLAPPSAAGLHQDAHRRGLGGAARHADLRLRQRRRSTRSAGNPATASTSASGTPTATRPPTAT